MLLLLTDQLLHENLQKETTTDNHTTWLCLNLLLYTEQLLKE